MAAERADLHPAAMAGKMLPQRWLLKAFIASGDLQVLYLLFVQTFTHCITHQFCNKTHEEHSIDPRISSVSEKNLSHNFSSVTFSLSSEVLSPGTTRTLYSCGKKSTKHSYRIDRALGLKVSCVGIFVRYVCAREVSETQKLRVIVLDSLSPCTYLFMMSRQTVNFPPFFCRELCQFELRESNNCTYICMCVLDVPIFSLLSIIFLQDCSPGKLFFQAYPCLLFLYCIKDIA